jgi:hypothetical protein
MYMVPYMAEFWWNARDCRIFDAESVVDPAAG